MAVERVKVNRKAIAAILKGQEGNVRRDLDARGRRIAAAAGEGHAVEGAVGRTRYRVGVYTTGRRTAEQLNALRRALGAGK